MKTQFTSSSDMMARVHINNFCNFWVFLQGNEHACWFLVDGEGRNHGPHSILELYNWQQHGYVSDAALVSCYEYRLVKIFEILWLVKYHAITITMYAIFLVV